jgi:peptidoglycan/xylan/chitin deacetylase (PgdA/CDA1 family)
MRRREFISRVLAASAVPIVAGCASSATSTHQVRYLPVLAWHQVVGGVARTAAQDVIWDYNKDCEPTAAVCAAPMNDETVSLAQLNAQLSWLKAQGYASISADQYHGWVSGASVPLPAKPVLLTIDDGTLNSYVGVTALLAKYGFNMVTFIVTQFADGATANLEPYVGWNASWDQLLALPSAQWSFAFHAGAHGHNITFPNNAACQYYYPCQLPTETVSDYRSRVDEEITTGRQTAAKMLGTRMNDKIWAVPWGDLGIQSDLPAEGDAKTWLAPWAASQFPVIFIQDPQHNGYLHERYRLVVQGTWSQAVFEKYVEGNIGDGFFNV